MCILEINNVSKKYKRRNRELTVLDGLNLKVEKGSFNAVEGESGSGKSTLLGILAGLTDIDEGSVIYHKDSESGSVIDIHSLTESERAKLRRHDIVYMPQQQEIISELTVSENIMLVDVFNKENKDNSEIRLSYLTERLGLTDLKDEYPENISGGELRRLIVARAMYSNPKIVLADEPTNDLDRQNREVIGKAFREMTESGITVIVVTHDEELAKRADNRFLLKDGKLNEIKRRGSVTEGIKKNYN